MKTCLVVANQTLPGDTLATAMGDRIASGDGTFYVVVPLTRVSHGITLGEDESPDAARGRLKAFLSVLRGQGVEADGEVGDPDPVQAVRDVLRSRAIDEIILSTLPAGASRWLQRDVPSRLAREIELPLTVVTQAEAVEAAGH